MFASNQILKISGDMSQIEDALSFALKMYDIDTKHITYQIAKDGKYCLGWHDKDGWNKFQFDFDTHIVSEIIKQHIRKQAEPENPYKYYDGSSKKGFIMEAIVNMFSEEEEGVSHPFYGIVSFKPYINFYAK